MISDPLLENNNSSSRSSNNNNNNNVCMCVYYIFFSVIFILLTYYKILNLCRKSDVSSSDFYFKMDCMYLIENLIFPQQII